MGVGVVTDVKQYKVIVVFLRKLFIAIQRRGIAVTACSGTPSG